MSLYNQRAHLDAELVERALKDNDFRQALLNDPKSTIEKTWGISLPDGMNVHIHQEKPNELHVVLPTAASAGDSLSSEEMQPVVLSSWGHFADCTLECTQCSNNDTSCQPGPTEE